MFLVTKAKPFPLRLPLERDHHDDKGRAYLPADIAVLPQSSSLPTSEADRIRLVPHNGSISLYELGTTLMHQGPGCESEERT